LFNFVLGNYPNPAIDILQLRSNLASWLISKKFGYKNIYSFSGIVG
jgi:hypothetical protein